MDSQDYLDQIAASARPMKPAKRGIGGFFSSKWFKWGMVALALLMVIIIFGSMLGNRTTLEQRCTEMKLHIDNTSEVISEYQPLVKSSLLRSLSASLKGILANTSSQLNSYMVAAYNYNQDKVKEALVEEAQLARDELANDLFEAKINGLLDRVYAHKMANEIYLIMSDESGIANDSDDEDLKSLLSASYDSLNNLYTQFNDFSETK